MYDVNSKCADDFINHEEILETLAYADENKENIKLIDAIIEKAKKRKGLTHREASVCSPVLLKKRTRKSTNLPSRSKRLYETVSSFLRHFTCPTTVSTAVPTAPIT